MSKAILVMDMDIPTTCLECPLKYKSEEMPLGDFTYQSLFRCKYEPEDLDEDEGDMIFLNDIMMKSKPEWCPLREVPNKTDFRKAKTETVMNWIEGYNACIDKIMKGSES